jgi:hypothetical protein
MRGKRFGARLAPAAGMFEVRAPRNRFRSYRNRAPLEGPRSERLQMADRELIAAIITAGMLATLPIPQSRGPVTDAEGETIQRAVGHAVGFHRSILEGLGVDPFAGLPGHDTPRQ